jgi:hypothetical protein
MSQQIQITGGAKVRDLQDVIIGTSGVLSSLAFNVANGVPKLDVNGKILVSQLPNSVMEYKGVWNAATNSPTLTNGGAFNQGDVYLCDTAGTVNFGSGSPISFIVGDQAIYSGSVWQKAGGATGTVTSVAVTESGDTLNITGSPITTSGTINIGFNGTNLQYVNGAGNLTTFPTLITSIGLSMPSAFSVANSPLTANGTIAVTGAGVASQYIRGDGTLADFPSSGGGGSSVSYYLNGGTSQGTIGGTTYYEMSKTAVIGTGVDFTKTGDGFIVAFLTDANDPAQLNIPAGNWNYEIYASMSANGGTPQMYAELYVYDGTTFTLISTSSNEIIYDGTALNLYTFAMAVPATTLTLTDRLAVKLYATNSGGKTTTIHTQDGHLCQVITTFSTGITALNGLTAQVQYFQTGTSGTDFNISSTTATHTFNIPDASATARGLITTGTQTIAGTKTFSDATKNNGGIFLQNASSNSLAGYMNLGGLTNGVKFTSGGGISNSFTLPSATGYTFTFPNATGTLALTSDIPSLSGTAPISYSAGVISISQATTSTNGYLSSTDWSTFNGKQNALTLTTTGTSGAATLVGATLNIPNYAPDLSGYVTLAGTQTITGAKTFSTFTKFDGGVILKNNVSASLAGYVGLSAYSASGNKGINIDFDTYSASFYFSGTLPYQYTFPAASGTIALVGGSGVGTVTSVAALTIGTSGTDLSSSVANSTTTPVITLNVPTASATNRGALSSADWTTFNNKQGTITLTTTGTSGAATFSSNTLNIPDYGSALSGYLPLTGGTLTGSLGGTSASFSSTVTATGGFIIAASGTYKVVTNTNTTLGYLLRSGAWQGNTNNDLALAAETGFGIKFFTDGTVTEKLTLSPSGNLGLGVTPSAWSAGEFTALQIGSGSNGGSILGDKAYSVLHLVSNAYYSAGSFKYIKTGEAAAQFRVYAYDGSFVWDRAATGTANVNFSWSTIMQLFATGNLSVGASPSDNGYKLDVNGTGRFTGNLYLTNASNSIFYLTNTATNGKNWNLQSYLNGEFYIGVSGVANYLTLASTGAATFSNSVASAVGVSGSANTINQFILSNAGYRNSNTTISADTSTLSYYFLNYNDSSAVVYDRTLDIRVRGSADGTYGAGIIRFFANNYTSGSTETEIMNIKGTGVVKIISTTASSSGTTGALVVGGGVGVGGSVYASSFFETSDMRIKTLIQDNYQTKGIASITPKLYTKNGKVELGYYAQDFVGILDSAISKGSDDMLSLSYREVLVAKVYALEQEIKELKAK